MTVLILQTSIILITTELDVLISIRDGGKNRKKNWTTSGEGFW